MFAKSQLQTLLDEEILRATHVLKSQEVGSAEYQKTLDGLSLLSRMKEEDKSKFGSKDNLAVVAGNLAGIFMIIRHERVNVIASKAMSMLLSPRIKA